VAAEAPTAAATPCFQTERRPAAGAVVVAVAVVRICVVVMSISVSAAGHLV
jgi:hypothetical protein